MSAPIDLCPADHDLARRAARRLCARLPRRVSPAEVLLVTRAPDPQKPRKGGKRLPPPTAAEALAEVERARQAADAVEAGQRALAEEDARAAGGARPRLLDLFCGAGGSAAGYVRAGFEVTGVDVRPQPRYLLSGAAAFVQADALRPPFDLRDFDAVHASPPCQAYSALRTRWPGREHPDLVPATRALLAGCGRPWVMENVPGAPLARGSAMLCGSMFGLRCRRHRLFESSFCVLTPQCRHREQGTPLGVYGGGGGRRRPEKRKWGVRARLADLPAALGIGWMTMAEASQAVPPAYTCYLGAQLRRIVEGRR